MSSRSKVLFTYVAPLAVVLGMACDRTDVVAATERTPNAQPLPSSASAATEDARLTTQIQARFFTDPTVRGTTIDVSTKNGIVTLSGTVASDLARTKAVELARVIKGVVRVDDHLRVMPDTPTARTEPAPNWRLRGGPSPVPPLDAAWITTKIQAQFFASPDIKGRNIDVTTSADHVVTLRGRVDSAAARSEAVRIAQTTDGVTRVVDELEVDKTPSAPAQTRKHRGVGDVVEDAWITAKIQSKYFADDEVKGRHIDVDTRNGLVTLTGEVANAAERRQAIDIAKQTDGVQQVIDRLAITASATKSVASSRPDEWITIKIQSKFFLADETRGQQIGVETRDGVVTLKGTVATPDAKSAADEIARDTTGVRRVMNQLTVSETS